MSVRDIQKLWLTFAPALGNGAAYADTEWSVTVTNWSVTDASGNRPLKVAGDGSVRLIAQWAIESTWGEKPVGHANYFGFKRASRKGVQAGNVAAMAQPEQQTAGPASMVLPEATRNRIPQ